MKKILLVVLGIAFSILSYAQITWNARIGMNISNWTRYEGADVKAGFKIGGGMEYFLDNFWSVQSSLFLTTKGVKGNVVEGNSGTVNQMYIELPVMMAARFNMANKTFLVLSAGPYIACGVGGKIKPKVPLREEMSDVDTFSERGLKRFDGGVGLGMAIEVDRFIVGLDGQWGLVKLIDDSDLTVTGPEITNRKSPRNISASVTLGYKF